MYTVFLPLNSAEFWSVTCHTSTRHSVMLCVPATRTCALSQATWASYRLAQSCAFGLWHSLLCRCGCCSSRRRYDQSSIGCQCEMADCYAARGELAGRSVNQGGVLADVEGADAAKSVVNFLCANVISTALDRRPFADCCHARTKARLCCQ